MRTFLFLAACLAIATGPALAQYSPDEQINGVVRGIQAENSSGQVGEVVIYPRSGRFVVDMKGTAGKPQAVTIVRGFSCAPDAGPPVASLGYLSKSGTLITTTPMPLDHLLSGNYNVIVRNNTPGSRPVGCGHLYLQ